MQAATYRKLTSLVERFDRKRHTNRSNWVRDLFVALDWQSAAYAIKEDGHHGYRLTIDDLPVVNIITAAPRETEKVYAALNRAYNQDVGWVVASDFESLGLYGSYWVSHPNNVEGASVIQTDISDYLLDAHDLDLLTPEILSRNRLDEVYQNYRNRPRRLPIDGHLIGRMEHWRRLALHALNGDPAAIDNLVHRFINTLFLTRYLEDTGVLPYNLRLLIEKPGIRLIPELTALVDRVAELTGYRVLTHGDTSQMREAPLRTLIAELYGYPEWSVQYDFASLGVDIMGRFYEGYLRLQTTQPTQNNTKNANDLPMFEQPTFELLDVRKAHGIYYTPRFIVDYILNKLIDRFKAGNRNALPYVLDMTVGSGTFLTAGIHHLLERYPQKDKNFESLVAHLIGLDNDEKAIEAARLNLTAKLLAAGAEEPLPQLQLKSHDMLLDGPTGAHLPAFLPPGGVDMVIGNPPFINYEQLVDQYDPESLKVLFQMAEQRFDSYALFLESALKLLKPGGFCGLVVPSSVLRGAQAGSLRKWLTGQADLIEIIDFKDQIVFPRVNAYVCLLLFRKRMPGAAPVKVTVANIFSISKTPASQLARISVAPPGLAEGCEVFLASQPTGTALWNFKNDAEAEILKVLTNASDHRLGSIAEIKQGVKTGEDSIYTFDLDKYSGDNRPVPIDKKFLPVESGILIPLLRNRQMVRWFTEPRSLLLYPYDTKSGKPLAFEVMEKKYPRAAAYLLEHKARLSRRQSIRQRLWFELSEPRQATVIREEEALFIAEMSIRPTVTRTGLPHTAIVGSTGGGYWIFPDRNQGYGSELLMAFLNSIVAEWFLRLNATTWKGGYFSVPKHGLENIPVPNFLKNPESYAGREILRLTHLLSQHSQKSGGIGSQARENMEVSINSLFLEAIKFSASQVDYIRTRINSARNLILNTNFL